MGHGRARLFDGPAVEDLQHPVDDVPGGVRMLEMRIEPLHAGNLLLDGGPHFRRGWQETQVSAQIEGVEATTGAENAEGKTRTAFRPSRIGVGQARADRQEDDAILLVSPRKLGRGHVETALGDDDVGRLAARLVQRHRARWRTCARAQIRHSSDRNRDF